MGSGSPDPALPLYAAKISHTVTGGIHLLTLGDVHELQISGLGPGRQHPLLVVVQHLKRYNHLQLGDFVRLAQKEWQVLRCSEDNAQVGVVNTSEKSALKPPKHVVQDAYTYSARGM